MENTPTYDTINAALQRCGSTFSAAQTHGLLAGKLAVDGRGAGGDWLQQVLDGADARNAATGECQTALHDLFEVTLRQLSQRRSEFVPLLPDDQDSTATRARAMGSWCEGFLHGLVSAREDERIKKQLAADPVADIIKDMLQITRAAADDGGTEEDEAAYTELVEYLRVAAQLVYEELAELRPRVAPDDGAPANEVLH